MRTFAPVTNCGREPRRRQQACAEAGLSWRRAILEDARQLERLLRERERDGSPWARRRGRRNTNRLSGLSQHCDYTSLAVTPLLFVDMCIKVSRRDLHGAAELCIATAVA